MDRYFFRVEHQLLRSSAFQTLGGSAIKVYLTIGLHADFGTGWAYPSIRTIARQAGLSRQTVLTAVDELTRAGLLATSKSPGRSTAYQVLREAPPRPPAAGQKPAEAHRKLTSTGPLSLEDGHESVPESLVVSPSTGPVSYPLLAQFFGPAGPAGRPKQEQETRGNDTASIPIPGTPFRLSAEGRLLVAVDLQELLTAQGLPKRLAEKLATQKDPEAVAKVLLNALYLQSQGKLQNGPGYIRAGIEDGYELLPQVATRLERTRKELEASLRTSAARQQQKQAEAARAEEEAAVDLLLGQLGSEELAQLVQDAVGALPQPLVRRNPTLSNPFVRAKVYELAGGEPIA